MKIEIIQDDTRESLLQYESDLLPLIGDRFAGMHFKDQYGRTTLYRMVMPNNPTWLVIYVEYTHPDLVKSLEAGKKLIQTT